MLPEPVSVTLLVTDVFERLGVPYVVGGSFASTVHGVVRTTLDTDIVADLQIGQAQSFASALADTFYVDPESVREAIRKRSSFNVIHLRTMFKVDVFIPKDRPFDQQQLARRRPWSVGSTPERVIYVASPEDTILAKLEWYRLGDEVSERQWRDILGMLEVQRGSLDMSYMTHWARLLRVDDLLERASRETPAV
jgi:hypothetical protein